MDNSIKSLVWSFSLFWILLLVLFNLEHSCWFHHGDEYSFSEILSLIFYASCGILSITQSKNHWLYIVLSFIFFIAFMEEANWGQNFFTSLSPLQLESDLTQTSIHNWMQRNNFGDNIVFNFGVELAQIALYVIIPLLLCKKVCHRYLLVPLLGWILLIATVGLQFDLGFYYINLDFWTLNCMGGSQDEAHELYFASTCFYYLYFWLKLREQ